MKYPPLIFPGFLFVGMVCLLASGACRRAPCDPVSEPYCSLSLYYEGQMAPYEKVYLPQHIRTNAFYALATTDSLPLSVVSDTTVYVFESLTRRDIVGIGYTRDIHYQTADCGLVITLKNLHVLPFSTIPADRIELETEPRSAGFFFGPRRRTTTYALSIRP